MNQERWSSKNGIMLKIRLENSRNIWDQLLDMDQTENELGKMQQRILMRNQNTLFRQYKNKSALVLAET